MKKIYFMYGLPRAGNTLLGSILNQNPKINATANSVLPEMMFVLNNIKSYDVAYNNFPDEKSLDNVLENLFDSYYQDWDGDFIIERGAWITPFNFALLERYFQSDIKIVVLVRNVLDVIKSYLHLCDSDVDFYINLRYRELDPTTVYKNAIEEKCDLIMQKGETVDKMLYSINWLLKNKKQDCLHFIEYDNLVKDPESEVRGVYDFYGIDHFDHHFTNLEQFSVNGTSYDDGIPGTAINMHKIRTDKIKPLTHSIELPKSVVSKYSNLELWK